jgi:endonuclease IV
LARSFFETDLNQRVPEEKQPDRRYYMDHKHRHMDDQDCDSCDEDNDNIELVIKKMGLLDRQDEPICISDFVKLGSHVPFQNRRLFDTLKWGIGLGMYAQQFYLGGRQQYTRTKIYPVDLAQTNTLLQQYPCDVFIHACVNYNMAGSCRLKKFAWDGDDETDMMVIKMIEGLDHELSVLNQIAPHGKGVVLHPGYWMRTGKETPAQEVEKTHKALATISQSLNLLKNLTGTAKILLENSAGQKGKLTVDLPQMVQIRDACVFKTHIAFCIDTAHIQGSGLYDLSTIEGVDRMFEDFDKYGHVELIHLNDSKVPLFSNTDRHQLIGQGTIWGKSIIPLQRLLLHARKRQIPLVLETSPSDVLTMHHIVNQIPGEWLI